VQNFLTVFLNGEEDVNKCSDHDCEGGFAAKVYWFICCLRSSFLRKLLFDIYYVLCFSLTYGKLVRFNLVFMSYLSKCSRTNFLTAMGFLVLVIVSGGWFVFDKLDSQRFDVPARSQSSARLMDDYSLSPTPFFPGYDMNLMQ
jgi:hypothetical protein